MKRSLLVSELDRLVFDPPPVSDGCVLYMPGLPGAGATIYDRSPYGNKGAITGATWTRLPSGLWALSFNGTDAFVAIGSAGDLQYTAAPLTMICWVSISSSKAQVIFGNLDDSNGYTIQINNVTNILDFFINNGTDKRSTVGLTLNVWSLVIVTWDGTTVRHYLNGVTNGTNSLTGTITATSSAMNWGRSPVSGGYLVGMMALPRIYPSTLTATQIANIFSQERNLLGV